LAQVIPTISRLDPYGQTLGPATIYFLSLSAVIHAVALWQFHIPPDDERYTNLDSEISDTLSQNALAHVQVLETISSPGSRFDLELVKAVCVCLRSLLAGLDDIKTTNLGESMRIIAHYRWCINGTGISRLASSSAQQHWRYDRPSWQHELKPSYVHLMADIEERRDAIIQLGNPEYRVCRSGFFDLSIRLG
jgi:hypothetical protein